MKELNLPPFYVGQKVVSITDISNPIYYSVIIKKGQQFTVRECIDNVLFLVEIINPNHPDIIDGGEPAYDTCWFAPVQENFQSISLEKILEQETSLISAS